ncbi:MAG: hypothetical protein AB7T06_25735 [Kofleriaceae bacterium]
MTDAAIGIDPTVLYYVRAQGLLVIAFALFIGLGCAIVPLFAKGKIEARHIPWLVVGVAVFVIFMYSGVRTLSLQAPPISLGADGVLHVGDRSVRLDSTTVIAYDGDASDLALPARDKRGYGAMPSAIDFPPRFAGGPAITIRTGADAVSLQPLLYGPSAYIESARPEASALVQRIAAIGTEGNARAWLASAFAPDDAATEPPRFRTFLIMFLCIATPILGMLATAVAIGLKRRLLP